MDVFLVQIVDFQNVGKNMNERDFIYWLQGFLELTNETTLDEKQINQIKEHIKLVLTKKTPVSLHDLPRKYDGLGHSTKYC